LRHNTGLYIRKRKSGELWQLFLGGNTAILPSELYTNWHSHFRHLHNDYECEVLERRGIGLTKRHAVYRYGTHEKYTVFVDEERLVGFVGCVPHSYPAKMVECLSLWHEDDNKMFMGSIANRQCPKCIRAEKRHLARKCR